MKLTTIKSILAAALCAVGLAAFAGTVTKPDGAEWLVEGQIWYQFTDTDNPPDGVNDTITIGGAGAMPDYTNTSHETLPWFANGGCAQYKHLIVQEGITKIGDYAFSYMFDLSDYSIGLLDVKLPSTLTSIGSYAFYSCRAIQDVNLAECSNLETIGDYAFNACWTEQLVDPVTITIPANVTTIGAHAFASCGFSKLIFAEGSKLETIGDYAFAGVQCVEEIAFPASLKSIGECSFRCVDPYTSRLKSVTFAADSKLETIGASAFECCKVLEAIAIPAGVTSIGDSAFKDCFKLQEITIQAGVTTIGASMFENCELLEEIAIPASVTNIGDKAFYCDSSKSPKHYSKLKSVTFAEGSKLETIGASAFERCAELEEIAIPASVTSIGAYAFRYDTKLSTLYIDSIESWLKVTIGSHPFYSVSSTVSTSLYVGGELTTEIVIPEGTETIGDNVFYNCNGLERVTFAPGSKIETIGKSAFYNCTKLPEITLPTGVTTIGDNAFYGCSALKWVHIPAGVTTIGSMSFYGCSALESVHIPASVTTFSLAPNPNNGSLAFSGCKALQSVSIPAGVTAIPKNTFGNCTALKSITVNASDPMTALADNTANTIPATIEMILVPDDKVDDYKAATNWSSDGIKEKIFGIGEAYIVTGAAEHGALAFDKNAFLKKDYTTANETVTITVMPDVGCTFKEGTLKATYNDGTEKTCTLTPGEGNTYTFTMPLANVTVSAEFEGPPPQGVEVTLPTTVGYGFAVSNLTAGAEGAIQPTEVGGTTYLLPIGAKVGIYAVPEEGYVVTGKPYIIEEVTSDTTIDTSKLPTAEKGSPVGEGTYVYAKDGNCTIFGTGSVTNFPAGFDRNSISNAVVEVGVTEIGEAFFYKCRKLKTVTLGKDVVKVGTNAFYLCVKLEKITVGNAAAVESLAGAVVIRAAFDSEGYPCMVPQIEAPDWKMVMLATDNLAEPKWEPIDPKEAFADGAPARFFKFVIQPITIE